MLLLYYPKCTTCKKAVCYLEEKGVDVEKRDIKTANPSAIELEIWHKQSGLPLKRFFNTSGLQYKALGLKEKLALMSEREQIELLETDGMLVKRPILVGENFLMVGFKEKDWAEALAQKSAWEENDEIV